jgi:hypothetical protein
MKCALGFSVLVGAAALLVGGCGGAPPAIDRVSGTFYQFDEEPSSSGHNAFERPYPPLNLPPSGAEYVGVSVLGGTVRLSRPAGWRIRRASLSPERRYIEYVSPEEFLFAIYERLDSPADPWNDVLGRYEEDAKAKGAELLGLDEKEKASVAAGETIRAGVPVATWNTQGREYVVRRTVRGQRAPYTSTSREVLLRSDHRVDLVEIVHQGDTPTLITPELLRVMETIEVL